LQLPTGADSGEPHLIVIVKRCATPVAFHYLSSEVLDVVVPELVRRTTVPTRKRSRKDFEVRTSWLDDGHFTGIEL
jgi:hypothetical protein